MFILKFVKKKVVVCYVVYTHHTYDMLAHHRITYNDLVFIIEF